MVFITRRIAVSLLLALTAVPAWALKVKAVDVNGKAVPNTLVYLTGKAVKMQARPAPSVMDQRNREFVPHVLAVQTGTQVVFPNSDNIRHHIYSFSPAKTFERKLYSGSKAAPVVFDKPGKVVLGCNIHDSMLGYIYVVDSPYFAVSHKNGIANLGAIAPGKYTLHIRQPQAQPVAKRTITVTTKSQTVVVNVGKLAPDPRTLAPKTKLEAMFDS